MNNPALDAEPRSAVIVRRLTGLTVLLILLFVCSLLTHQPVDGRPASGQPLPTVVIPLHQASPDLENPARSVDQTQAETRPSTSDPVMQRVGGPPVAAVTTAPASSPTTETQKAMPSPVTSMSGGAESKRKVEPRQKIEPLPKVPPQVARWWVTVGAFRDATTAQALAQRIRSAGFKATVSAALSQGEKLHRVSAGPFEKKAEAEAARATLIVEGMTKAIVQSGN